MLQTSDLDCTLQASLNDSNEVRNDKNELQSTVFGLVCGHFKYTLSNHYYSKLMEKQTFACVFLNKYY